MSDAKGGWEEIIQVPTLVDALDPSNHGGAKVIKVDGGEHHSLFLFDNGEVWGCGRCDGAQLGLGAEHPARKELKERVDEEIEKKRLERVESGVEDDPMAPPPAVDEFIPEPVQVSFPSSVLSLQWLEKLTRSSFVFRSSSLPLPPLPTPLPTSTLTLPRQRSTPLIPWSPSPLEPDTTSPSRRRGTSTLGDTEVSLSFLFVEASFLHVLIRFRFCCFLFSDQCQLGLGPDVETAEVPARVRSKVRPVSLVSSSSLAPVDLFLPSPTLQGLNDFNVIDASAGG